MAITAAFTWLSWKDLSKALLLLIALLPSYLIRIEIIGIPTTLLECLFISLILVWLVKRRDIWKRKRFWGTKALLPIGLLLAASTISIVISPNFVAALGVWKAYVIEPVALFFIFRYELQAKTLNQHQIFLAFGVSALAISLFALFQYATGYGLPIPWDIERRITSVFNYPNAVGLFLGPIVIIGILQSHTAHKRFWQATTLLSLMSILLAKSEAALVAIIATLILAGLWKKRTRLSTISILIIGGLLTWISPWKNFALEKLTLQDYSGSVRISQWTETATMLQEHWLLGAGLSGYPTVFEPFHLATHLEIFQYPHNILLNIWVELGLLGVIAMGILAFTVWQTRKHNATLIPLLVLTQMSIHGLVDVPYFKNDLAIMTWIFLAIIFAYAGTSVLQKKTTT